MIGGFVNRGGSTSSPQRGPAQLRAVLRQAPDERYRRETIPRQLGAEDLEQLAEALAQRGVTMEYLPTGEAALARLKELVPLGAEVMTGSSTTLEQIGFVDWITALHHAGRLRYFRAEVHQNTDPEAREENRRQATLAEYFVGSVNALAMTGEAVAADHAGTRVGGYVYAARHVIWVVGVNKIVPTLDDAIRRVRAHALPMEDARVKAEGGAGSSIGKLVVFCEESRPNRIRMLLVGEELGF